MERKYTYYAFISYSHKDQKWAEWIQQAVEHYKLPSVIRKEAQKPLPKRMRPVFLDKTDLSVDVLVDGLHAELEQSQYLIVVCSPNSAQPNAQGKRFVDEEVRHFCELGRTKQIIPVIVEGSPEESFGPVLKEKEILALDATKHPRSRILNDIVAKILGLKPDALWRRAERERKKRLIIKSVIGGFLALLTAFAGYFAWDANRTAVNYYADYVDSFGLPEGLFPLTKQETKGRRFHYRFEYRGYGLGKSVHHDSSDWNIFKPLGFYRVLRSVVQANSAGMPKKLTDEGFSERPAIQDFTYEQDGLNLGKRLKQVRHGRFGGPNRTPYFEKRIEFYNHSGTTNGLAKFLNNSDNQFDFANAAALLPFDTDLLNPKRYSAVIQHQLQRDSQGRVKQRLFLNATGGKESDGDGVRGFSCECDAIGRETLERYLICDGDGVENAYQANRIGISGKRMVFDGKRLLKVEFLDAAGQLAMNPKGWMACEFGAFDGYDNPCRFRYIDEKGQLMFTKDGYAEIRMAYDEFGNVEKMLFYDVDGKATLCNEGVAGWEWEYDSLGRQISQRGVDAAGHVVVGKNGVACTQFSYDAYGNMTNESYYGVDGAPQLCNQWYARLCHQYDQQGRKQFSAYYGLDGWLTLSRDGSAIIAYEYYDDGKTKSATSYGCDGSPVLNKNGFCRASIDQYDENGNVNVVSVRDIYDKPIVCSAGAAKIVAKYDEHGQMERVLMLGTSDEKVVGEKGFAEAGFVYGKKGEVVKVSCYGVDGNLKLCRDGYAERSIIEYDGRGMSSKVVLRNADGNVLSNSPCRVSMVWDQYGRLSQIRWFDEHGTPMRNEDGCFEIRCKRDQFGNVTNEFYLGLNGEKIKCNEGYAEWRGTYDKYGRLEQKSFYGEDGRSVECTNGYAKVCYWYDSLGDCDQVDYLALTGRRQVDRRVIVVQEVQSDSLAASFGVRSGDIVCWLKGACSPGPPQDFESGLGIPGLDSCDHEPYDLLSTREIRGFPSLLDRTQNGWKELVVARRTGKAYEIRAFVFPVGEMGLYVGDGHVGDYVELEQAYKAYREKKKGEMK